MTALANQVILEALSAMRYTRTYGSAGICYNLQQACIDAGYSYDDIEAWLRRAFCILGLDKTYPVPDPSFASNEAAYDHYNTCSSMPPYWQKGHPYAANRYHLLSLLIDLAEGKTRTPRDVCWPHPPKGTVMSYRQKVLSINSLQGVFDHAVTRVIRNRRPAYDADDGSCQYRTARVGGYRSVCAVGSLILDGYTKDIEGSSVRAAFFTLPDNIQSIPDVAGLLAELQKAHDTPAHYWARGDITRKEFINQFLNRAIRVAQKHGLSHEVVRQ